MSVFRVEKNKNFTVMSNYHLKDIALSLKAKGMLSLMLSLPDSWDYTINGLATICKDGVDSIKKAVKELEENGYIHRERVRNEKGHLTGIVYTIYEEPKRIDNNSKNTEDNNSEEDNPKEINDNSNENIVDENNDSTKTEPKTENPLLDSPTTENPITAFPMLDKPIMEKHIQSSTKELNINLLNTNTLITNQSNPYQSSTNCDEVDEIENLEKKYNNYLELIKLNIEYKYLCESFKGQKESIDEIVDIMLETICTTKKTVTICGQAFPVEVVKSKFLKINQFHIEYILDCLSKNTTKVNNIKSYLKACIYNAPSTIKSYYNAAVNHDMYGI